jgi:hypothetical protein
LCPDTLAKHIVQLNLRDLEALFNGVIRALAKAGVFGTKVTGMADGTDWATTERYTGGGQVTRQVRIEEKRGRVHAIEVTVYGWTVRLLIDAATKMPLAVNVGKMHAHEALWTRALVTQAQANLAADPRLRTVVFDKGFWAGTDVWWLDQHGLTFVVPAKAKMAVTADSRAHAVAGERLTIGRRVHTVRHGQGNMAWAERLATEVVGITPTVTTFSPTRSRPWWSASGKARIMGRVVDPSF